MFRVKWYFCNMLMSSYEGGTQKELEQKIKDAGEEDIFFGMKYNKTGPNRAEARDDAGSIIVIEFV